MSRNVEAMGDGPPIERTMFFVVAAVDRIRDHHQHVVVVAVGLREEECGGASTPLLAFTTTCFQVLLLQ
jgi:hypothetical protein